MLPIGTRVTITSVDHLAIDGKKPPRRLLGRTATVADHENGMNIVSGLTSTELLAGHYVFADDHVTVVGTGPVPALPPLYRVRAYLIRHGRGAGL